MWAPRGRKKQLPGLSLWKKKSSCSCGGVGAGKTSPRGTPASEPQKSRVLFQGSKFAKGSPGRCGGGRGERRRPAPAARPPAPGCWGRRRRPRAAASGAPRGPPKTRPSSAGRERSKTGGGWRWGGNPDGWVPNQPRVPRPAELTVSTRRAPISPVCPRRGPRQSCSSGPHLRGRRTDKRTQQMDRRTQQAAVSPPCPQQPTDCHPGHPALTDRQWPWGTSPPPGSAAAGSCCAKGGARRVAEVSAGSERDVLGEGTPEGGLTLKSSPSCSRVASRRSKRCWARAKAMQASSSAGSSLRCTVLRARG